MPQQATALTRSCGAPRDREQIGNHSDPVEGADPQWLLGQRRLGTAAPRTRPTCANRVALTASRTLACRDHWRAEGEGRSDLGRLLVGGHRESARGDGADHLPALHPPAGRTAHDEGEPGESARNQPRRPGLSARRRRSRLRVRGPALVALQGPRSGRDVRDRRRARFPVPTPAWRREVDLLASHARCAIHDPSTARQGRRHARRTADGGPRHQGRHLRVHAEQDCDRWTEWPVPHATAHHRPDGRDDSADAQGRDLRSGVRDRRLPHSRERLRPAHPSRSRDRSRGPRPLPQQHVPRLRLRQHHASDRVDEHAPARGGSSRHPLSRLSLRGRRRRGGHLLPHPRQSAIRR